MDYQKLPNIELITKVTAELENRGVKVFFVQNKIEAFEKLKALIPPQSEIMTGSSTTLEQIGFVDYLKSGQHPWKNLKDAIVAEKDPDKQAFLRKQSVTSQFFIGSVHAITEYGQTLTASGSGSQIPSYAFSSENVIWVVGAHKIVATLEDGLKRIREYCLPLENQRMLNLGYGGTNIGKILIFEKEISPKRHINLILVNEILGF